MINARVISKARMTGMVMYKATFAFGQTMQRAMMTTTLWMADIV